MTDETHNKPLIIITGSEGMLGTRLRSELSREFQIARLDVDKPEDEQTPDNWFECDLTDDESVKHALTSVRQKFGDRIGSVIHLAAYYDFSGDDSPLYRELTVKGTKRLLDSLRDFTVEQFIFSSSLLAMKPVVDESEKLTEASPVMAEWAYPQSKLEAESMLRAEHGGIPVVILRIAGVYDDDCHSLPISRHIARIYEKRQESYFFPGDKNHGQSYLHLDDLADCVRKTVLARKSLEPYEIFLVGEPDVMSHKDLQNELGELIHGEEWPTVRIPEQIAKAGAWTKNVLSGGDEFIKPWMIDLADDHYPVDISKAERKLEWRPSHRLRDVLPKMVAKLKEDPRSWYQENGLSMPSRAIPVARQ